MQFMTLNDLNETLEMLRIREYNSPTFHDKQNPEIDHLFHHSPVATVTSPIDLELKLLLNTDNDHLAETTKTDENQTKEINKLNIKKNNDYLHLDSSLMNTDDHNIINNGIQFEKQEIVMNDIKDSLLEKIFKKKDKDAIASLNNLIPDTSKSLTNDNINQLYNINNKDEYSVKRYSSQINNNQFYSNSNNNIGGPTLSIIIYLPNQEKIVMEIPEISTVEDTINKILYYHENNVQTKDKNKYKLYYNHPELYDLRLHDQNGLPDEDFPALDRSRKVKNFGDAGGHEYCLCERPDVPLERENNSKNSQKNSLITSSEEAIDITNYSSNNSTSHSYSQKTKSIIKVHMPNEDYAVVAINENTTGNDLFTIINKKHRLPFFQEKYMFKLLDVDKYRLQLANGIIKMETKIKTLDVSELALCTHDSISSLNPALSNQSLSIDDDKTKMNSRPSQEIFMFNDITATMFKEWKVIKKNKYGKRQRRMLGIDQYNIYNRKVGDKVVRPRSSTKKAERPISGVTRIEYLPEPCDFRIVYSYPESISIDYTAETPYECAEITAKLNYILSRRI